MYRNGFVRSAYEKSCVFSDHRQAGCRIELHTIPCYNMTEATAVYRYRTGGLPMETRFECSFETTKENVQEFSRYFHFHTAYILIPALAMLVLLGLTLYEIVCYGWYRQQLLQLILALVIFPALLLYRYKRDVKTILARSRELHGDKPAVSRTLFTRSPCWMPTATLIPLHTRTCSR